MLKEVRINFHPELTVMFFAPSRRTCGLSCHVAFHELNDLVFAFPACHAATFCLLFDRVADYQQCTP